MLNTINKPAGSGIINNDLVVIFITKTHFSVMKTGCIRQVRFGLKYERL